MKQIAKVIATIFVVVLPPMVAWGTFFKPLILHIDARSWIQTETTDLLVRVESRRGQTYTIAKYTFVHSSGEASGDKVSFWSGYSMNGIDSRLDGVNRSGVWYDPSDPQRSVLFRDIDWIALAFGLIPCCFSVISFYIVFGIIRVVIRPSMNKLIQAR
jgi:Protein of unknown function (DUF3592)